MTMGQIIIVPYNDQEIGQGFNSESRENVGTALTVANISEDPVANGQIVRTFFNNVTSQESLMESLGISASVDARYGLFSGGAKMDFSESHAVNSFSSFVVGRCEVNNASRHGKGFQLTPDAQAVLSTGDMANFKKAFGDMFVRSLKTGGEFYVVAQITSISEEHQSKMAASLHAECNGLIASGSFKASFETATHETSGRSEVMVFMSQSGGIGGQATFTGPDATKILERLNTFPQSTLEHPVGYEAELAAYDTIPIPIPVAEVMEDREIVLADCLQQKMAYLKALSDLRFVLGPSGTVFFDDIPPMNDLQIIERQYRDALNGLMAHAILVATGKMNPPQVYVANPAPPPLNLKKRSVSNDDKVNFGNRGMAIANTDAVVAAFRNLQPEGPRRVGFDIGMGITENHTLWGPGKQLMLDSLSFDEQIGFRQASTFCLIRNTNAVLSSKGADIANVDPAVSAIRNHETSGLYWLGFDIATGIFGPSSLGGLGHTSPGPGSDKIRATIHDLEHVLLPSDEGMRGYDASQIFNLARAH